jgi:hypothetical protein
MLIAIRRTKRNRTRRAFNVAVVNGVEAIVGSHHCEGPRSVVERRVKDVEHEVDEPES